MPSPSSQHSRTEQQLRFRSLMDLWEVTLLSGVFRT